MSASVSWVLNATINDGKLDEFKALAETMVAVTKAFDNALNYEWFISDDGKQLSIYERYADSDAVLEHLGAVGPHLDAFMACLTMQAPFLLYGAADARVREAMAGFGAVVLQRFNGFAR